MYQPPALIPPFRFARVEDGLFRGAYPSLKNFRFLRRLHLRTIVSLLPSAPSDDLKEFCLHENIRLIFIHVEKFEENVTFTPQLLARIVTILGDQHNLPLFIHCLDGGHNTGLVIMALRLLQGWNMSVIFTEFCRYVKTGEISREESQFLESFNEEIELPCTPASFLTSSLQIGKSGGLRIRPKLVPKSTLRNQPLNNNIKNDDSKVDNTNNVVDKATLEGGNFYSKREMGRNVVKEGIRVSDSNKKELQRFEDVEESAKLAYVSERMKHKKLNLLSEKEEEAWRNLEFPSLNAIKEREEEEEREMERYASLSSGSEQSGEEEAVVDMEEEYSLPNLISYYRYPKRSSLGRKFLSKFVRSNSLDDIHLRYSKTFFPHRTEMKNVARKTKRKGISSLLEALALEKLGKA